MGLFAICALPSHRNNFETFMLKMQYHEMMTDLKKMPQELSGALSKCKELTKENQMYWWVTTMVMTQVFRTACVCPSLSLNQSESSGYIYCILLKRILPPSKRGSRVFTSSNHFDKVWRVCEPLQPFYFPFQYSWDRKGLNNDRDFNQPWASWALEVDL